MQRSNCSVQISRPQFKRANATAAAEIIDGGYCKYGSASKSDNSEKYCKTRKKKKKKKYQYLTANKREMRSNKRCNTNNGNIEEKNENEKNRKKKKIEIKSPKLTCAKYLTSFGISSISGYAFKNTDVVGTHKSKVRTFKISCSIRSTCFFEYVVSVI